MKTRKEKEIKQSWGKVFRKKQRRRILVTSTIISPDGSVVSALASQAKGRWINPKLCKSFLSTKPFPILPFQPLI